MRKSVKAVMILFLFILPFLLAGCQAPGSAGPQISPPTIDGILSPGEWDGARQESLKMGNLLYLMTDGDYLYLGIRSSLPDLVLGNVFIQQGDEISVLHISAALGTAIYQREGETWQRIQDFTWQCRDYSDSPTAVAERAAFLEKDGWLGSISYQGTLEELEYQIKLPAGPVRLLVWMMSAGLRDVPFLWPAETTDTFDNIPMGDTPGSFVFTPEDWAEVRITRDGRLEVTLPGE